MRICPRLMSFRATRTDLAGGGSQQFDIATAEKAPREQRRADDKDSQRTANRAESADQARGGREMQRPGNAQDQRQQVRDDEPPKILEGGDQHHDSEYRKRDDVGLQKHQTGKLRVGLS